MPLIGSLRTLLLRGLLAGLIAGLLAATVGYFVGEPKLDAAIAIEEAGSAAGHTHGEHAESPGGHSHGDEEEPLVSRGGQKFGQFLALGLAGVALGAVFASVAHFARRYTTLSGPRLTLLLGLAGWAAIVAVPFFKYPANPPAVGDPDTVDERTLLWLAAVLLGIVAVGTAVAVFTALRAQLPTFRLIGGVAAFVLVTALGYVLLPGVNEVGADFPATLLWQFRVASLAETATLWACLALGFAALTEFATRTDTAVGAAVATAE
ncbi:CbtA family protein [Streptomyces gardneri]|uniref:CbtA family protein n=1 Tax=Nocardia TaxID=1817 RepID=UPI00135740AE|nr:MULTISPECIES: CbtA family protein [Nocardia]MBF6165199.1 CbtA family protein [Streptomyces gardneri]MBF6208119.1 CbtA family protein [Streptomyces gardneri]